MSADQPMVDDLADVLSRVVIGWEDRLGIDLAQYPDVVRVMARYRASKLPCPAVIYHGPGHQSRTKCERRDEHLGDGEHMAHVMEERVFWTGMVASLDYSGYAREVVLCPDCGVLRDPGDTSPCRGYVCEQKRKS